MDIIVPESVKRSMEATRRQIADWEESQKVAKRYPDLKRRLETILEVNATSGDEEVSIKDQRAVSYFENCKAQIEDKIKEEDVRAKKYIEQYLAQVEQTKANLRNKLLFVETRLSAALERTEKKKKKAKSKEQINLEKEIQEVVGKYLGLVPNVNQEELSQVFPGVLSFGLSLALPEVSPPKEVYTAPKGDTATSVSVKEEKKEEVTEPKPIIKRRAKQVERRKSVKPGSEEVETKEAKESLDRPVSPLPESNPVVYPSPAPLSPPPKVYTSQTPHTSIHPKKIPENHPLASLYNTMDDASKEFLFNSRPDIFAKIKIPTAVEEHSEPVVAEKVVFVPKPKPSVPAMPTIIQHTRR